MKRMCLLISIAALLLQPGDKAWSLKFNAALDTIKISAEAGQTINRSFKLSLAKDEKRTQFKLHTEDWWRSEDGKQSYYRKPGSPGNPSRSCARWIKLNPVETAVEPGGDLNAKITVEVPSDVKPGGYWCVLTVDEVPDPLSKKPEGIGVSFNTSISVAIFVYISPLERKAKIVDVKILPSQITVKLRNEGNCPLHVEGRLEFIKPGETRPTATAEVVRETLLPEPINTGIFSSNLPAADILPSGRYLVRAILDIGLDHYIGIQKEMDINRDQIDTTQAK